MMQSRACRQLRPETTAVVDPRLLADIQRAESCKLTAYRDSRGFWTIGWGHLLDQTIDWTGHTIDQATADSLLLLDIEERQSEAQTLPEWDALDTPCRQNAVTECVFNLGLAHWHNEFPATRASIQAQMWLAAQANLLDSPAWVAQVGRYRVSRLAGYLGTGAYPQPGI